MDESELEAAWQQYKQEMEQILQERSAILDEEARANAMQRLDSVRSRLGLS